MRRKDRDHDLCPPLGEEEAGSPTSLNRFDMNICQRFNVQSADPALPPLRFEFSASEVCTAADIEEGEGQQSVETNSNMGKLHDTRGVRYKCTLDTCLWNQQRHKKGFSFALNYGRL